MFPRFWNEFNTHLKHFMPSSTIGLFLVPKDAFPGAVVTFWYGLVALRADCLILPKAPLDHLPWDLFQKPGCLPGRGSSG